ncbi:MAG: S-layer homology domain-containing protein [Clostridia bacterium]|nr:S-layer homology domain-containing protein [Clostridia bacterium]
MKKFSFAIILFAVVMLLTIAASAAVGTVVTADKTDKAPNLEEIDGTWGEPAIVVNSKSPNTELFNYWNRDKFYTSRDRLDHYFQLVDGGQMSPIAPEDYDVELYYLWDAKYLYFGLKTEDHEYCGWNYCWAGDGVQMWIQPMEVAADEGSLYTGVNAHDTVDERASLYDFAWTLDTDDYSTTVWTPYHKNAAQQCDVNINTDNNGELHCTIRIPWSLFGLNNKAANGIELATAVLRVSSRSVFENDPYAGWLSWGKYFTDCTAESLNTIVLSDGSAPVDTTPADTEDTTVEITPNLDGVSSWALAEVEAGIKEGLVPANLQANYTSPVTRGAVAQMFVNLLEKAAGKSIDDIMAEKGVAINEGAFTDTTDKAVLAANALGIINGTGSGKFSPDGTLKRAQIAAIINRVARVMGIETDGFTHEFNDITDNYKWADTELGWPVHAGVINGVGGGRFNPGGDLTTEQAILITYRALGALK